ncbi:MAG: transposase, partial [Acidihalobacter sp.]
MSKRRKFSPEFKREAVALTRQSGVSCRQIALEIGMNPNPLSRWKREADKASGQAFGGSGITCDQELAALKRELVRVKKERNFLREAATF